ncbi:Hpt domain-containing protein [Desulfosporosinus sp. Sb-LF]|uniref:Hpt domain-containing protein n=1 Tax=Desulfosporosinus sp. Sb-LF TaxID=2560027 RepID=UPI00107F5CFA|nr:Hpt domain-containing protein [Desulfosporosinus sp. Sb-LF]TGE32934.1 hypothetical protein E4K68_08790 [Desulfosporosinus sp. Sb-LF]
MSEESYLNREPMLEMFIFETLQLLEQLERILLNTEKSNNLSGEEVNQVFRIMHTIRGSSAMMMFKGISTLTHSLEELFYFFRDNKTQLIAFTRVCDLVLEAVDIIKREIAQIKEGTIPESGHEELSGEIKEYLISLRGSEGSAAEQKESLEIGLGERKVFYISSYVPPMERVERRYIIRIFFEDGCLMENIRAYTIIHNLKELCQELYYRPKDIIAENDSAEFINKNGFTIYLSSNTDEKVLREMIQEALFLKSYELTRVEGYEKDIRDLSHGLDLLVPNEEASVGNPAKVQSEKEYIEKSTRGLISVSINKLDRLMNLVGEIVIAESKVTRNPELAELGLDSFNEAFRQLQKLTGELQDVVTSIRTIPPG